MENGIFIQTEQDRISVYRGGTLLCREEAIAALTGLYQKEENPEGRTLLEGYLRQLKSIRV